ncbi:hypothetical protein GTY66_09985 [Streptomyces sp. SID8356]|nr:hypothetical protein [Streptomyces sp. SID8356]
MVLEQPHLDQSCLWLYADEDVSAVGCSGSVGQLQVVLIQSGDPKAMTG